MKPRTIRLAVLAAVTTVAIAAPLAASARSESPAAASVRSSHVVGYFIEWGIYGRNYKVKDVKTSGSADRAHGDQLRVRERGSRRRGGRRLQARRRVGRLPEALDRGRVRDRRGSDLAAPDPRQLPAAPGPEGPVPAPQGPDLARRLDVVEVLLGRGSHQAVARALRLVLHRPLHQGGHPGSGLGRHGRPRSRGRRLRRNRRRLGVAGLRRERRATSSGPRTRRTTSSCSRSSASSSAPTGSRRIASSCSRPSSPRARRRSTRASTCRRCSTR